MRPGCHAMQRNHCPPSLTTVVPASTRAHSRLVSAVWNPRTTCRRAYKGRLSAVVSTAMMKGVWPRRPRPEPGLPPVEWRGEITASCGCTHGDPFHAGPRLGRGAIADGRMQTLPIVEDFDVFEHGRLRLLAGAEADLVDVLRLERGEEALHGRVIEAVAAAAHGLRDAVPLQHRAVGLGRVLGGFKRPLQHLDEGVA